MNSNKVIPFPSNAGGDDKKDEKWATELTSATFDNEIKSGYTFVDFWAEWCQPCKIAEPIIKERIAPNWKGKIKFAKLNTDENSDIALRFNVLGIPTFILFKDGQPVGRMTGLNPQPVYEQFLTQNYQEADSGATAMPAAA